MEKMRIFVKEESDSIMQGYLNKCKIMKKHKLIQKLNNKLNI